MGGLVLHCMELYSNLYRYTSADVLKHMIQLPVVGSTEVLVCCTERRY